MGRLGNAARSGGGGASRRSARAASGCSRASSTRARGRVGLGARPARVARARGAREPLRRRARRRATPASSGWRGSISAISAARGARSGWSGSVARTRTRGLLARATPNRWCSACRCARRPRWRSSCRTRRTRARAWARSCWPRSPRANAWKPGTRRSGWSHRRARCSRPRIRTPRWDWSATRATTCCSRGAARARASRRRRCSAGDRRAPASHDRDGRAHDVEPARGPRRGHRPLGGARGGARGDGRRPLRRRPRAAGLRALGGRRHDAARAERGGVPRRSLVVTPGVAVPRRARRAREPVLGPRVDGDARGARRTDDGRPARARAGRRRRFPGLRLPAAGGFVDLDYGLRAGARRSRARSTCSSGRSSDGARAPRRTADGAGGRLSSQWPGRERRDFGSRRSARRRVDAGARRRADGRGAHGRRQVARVPAAGGAVAAERGARVIVATCTRSLQDQLFERDIPALLDALELRLDVAVLKGKSNYVCPRALEMAEGQGAEETEAIDALRAWAAPTRAATSIASAAPTPRRSGACARAWPPIPRRAAASPAGARERLARAPARSERGVARGGEPRAARARRRSRRPAPERRR